MTNVTTDINDPLSLAPNDFLLGRPALTVTPEIFYDRRITLTKTWKAAQLLATHFWNRIHREYLSEQQARSKWKKQTSNLKTGEIVGVLEDFNPCGIWPIEKVIKTLQTLTER